MAEVVIASAVFSLAVVMLAVTFTFYLRTGLATTNEMRAVYLLEEGLEAMRFVRDSGWSGVSGLSLNEEYGLAWQGGWQVVSEPQVVDGIFERGVAVLPVYRRTSDSDIVATSSPEAKSLDPNTKRINVWVHFPTRSGTSTVTSASYLTNIFNE